MPSGWAVRTRAMVTFLGDEIAMSAAMVLPVPLKPSPAAGELLFQLDPSPYKNP